MLTLFSIPKAFDGHIGIIQRNAIQSWLALRPHCEIVLCGDDRGTEAAAREFGVEHIPYIARNSYGTPLVNSAFELVERMASYSLLCYVNADIIFLDSLAAAIQARASAKCLMLGRRWDLDIFDAIDFTGDRWRADIKKHIAEHGALHPPTGIDYFVFPKGIGWGFPAFAVGRPGWDNWLIYRARQLGMAVVDASHAVTVVHQNHDYAHVKGATDHTTEGPEADRNRELTGGWGHVFTISDATHFLQPGSGPTYALKRNMATLPVSLLRPLKQINFLCGAGCRVIRRRFSSGA